MNLMRDAINRSALSEPSLRAASGHQQFRFAENFPGFSGHFPGYPVLPAVLQTLLAQMLAEQLLGRQLRLKVLQQAKFSRQIRPGELIHVDLQWRQQEELHRCQVVLRVDEETAAQFVLLLEEGSVA
ncbi:MAG: hypothetical protein R6V33_09580 [Pelovirga sp.]